MPDFRVYTFKNGHPVIVQIRAALAVKGFRQVPSSNGGTCAVTARFRRHRRQGESSGAKNRTTPPPKPERPWIVATLVIWIAVINFGVAHWSS